MHKDLHELEVEKVSFTEISPDFETISKERQRFGLSIIALKYIAIVLMFFDHFAYVFLSEQVYSSEPVTLYEIIRMFGRTTAPIMFFCAVEAYHHTKNLKKYFLRLGIFALISYFPFIYMSNGGQIEGLDFHRLNVMVTIFLGISAIFVRRNIKNPLLKVPVLFVLIGLSTSSDWDISGVLIILIFDYFYGNRQYQLFGFLLWILLDTQILRILTISFSEFLNYGRIYVGLDFICNQIISFGFFIPLVLLSLYNGDLGEQKFARLSKWVFYVFYPAHMLLLGYLKSLF